MSNATPPLEASQVPTPNTVESPNWRTQLVRAATASVLALAGLSAVEIAQPGAARADVLNYPWSDAAYVDANYDWGYSTCPGNDSGCMSPFSGYKQGVKYGETDPWNYYLRNCTSYVAWKLSTLGVNASGLGNGGEWYSKAPSSEQSSTPAAWDAAVEPISSAHPYGHVAFIESVNSVDANNPLNDNITVSEYNHSGDGNGDTRTGTASHLGFTEFVDFRVHPTSSPSASASAPPPPPPNLLLAHVGSELYGKANLTDAWTDLASSVTGKIEAASTRIAYLSNGTVYAKDGLSGAWLSEATGVNDFVLTPQVLVVREGSNVYAKGDLAGAWSTIATNAVDVEAAGSSIAHRDSSDNLYLNLGPTGPWYAELSGVDEYTVTPNLLVARSGASVYAKAAPTDAWTLEATNSTDEQASGTRIATVDTSHELYVKDGISGAWVNEENAGDQYEITPNLVLIRQAGTVIGKAALADAWVTLATTAASFDAADSRIAVLDASGNLAAKDGPSGTWYNVLSGVSDYIVGAQE